MKVQFVCWGVSDGDVPRFIGVYRQVYNGRMSEYRCACVCVCVWVWLWSCVSCVSLRVRIHMSVCTGCVCFSRMRPHQKYKPSVICPPHHQSVDQYHCPLINNARCYRVWHTHTHTHCTSIYTHGTSIRRDMLAVMEWNTSTHTHRHAGLQNWDNGWIAE